MKPLVIVGDALLDVDIEGTATRLSPEAPVPVVDARRHRRRPGGAGLAALLAARSTADVVLITPIGDDQDGRDLTDALGPVVRTIPLPLRGSTVCKTRIRAHGQSLVRVDHGDGVATADDPGQAARSALRGAGAILVADYGRGVTANPPLRALLTELATTVPVVWDPHPKGADPVPGATLVTPNESEATRLTGAPAEPVELALALCRTWDCGGVAVTAGERGAALSTTDGETAMLAATEAADNPAHDTCGAGDQFAVAVALGLRAGARLPDAVAGAVDAASTFVADGGAAALSINDIRVTGPATGAPWANAFELAERVRRDGGRLVATGGCFDLLHPGHISLLRRARALGDALVVCLNSDESVRRLKGPERPILPAEDRIRLLTELASVDAVLVFGEDSPTEVLDRLRPDVWVKGADYAGRELPEEAVLRRYGGELVLVPTVDGHSTSGLVAAVRSARGKERV